jgi:ATP-dependent Lhr-like helicase
MESRLAALEQWRSRHGVLTREAIAAEAKEGGFGAVYPLLRALEERGQVRRGYFIEGLGALQFADPGAVDRMRGLKDAAGRVPLAATVIAATDPANPFGVTLPWPSWCQGEAERRARAHVVIADGELTALFFADGARALVHLPEDPSDRERLARASALAIAEWMRRRALRIIGHETEGAPLNATVFAGPLREAGLVPSGPGFRL